MVSCDGKCNFHNIIDYHSLHLFSLKVCYLGCFCFCWQCCLQIGWKRLTCCKWINCNWNWTLSIVFHNSFPILQLRMPFLTSVSMCLPIEMHVAEHLFSLLRGMKLICNYCTEIGTEDDYGCIWMHLNASECIKKETPHVILFSSVPFFIEKLQFVRRSLKSATNSLKLLCTLLRHVLPVSERCVAMTVFWGVA